jgi:membrane-associated protease RseP (regulator of RpoE activity)
VSRGGAEQEVTATIGKRNNSSFAQGILGGDSRLFKWEGKEPKVWKWEGPPFDSNDLFKNQGDLTFMLGNSRRIGVSTMALTKQLAEYFGVTGGQGVLITAVTDDSPAAKAGVRAGDVITAVDGEAVDSSGDLSRVINRKKEGEVTLTIIRNKAQQTIRVTPKEGGGFTGTINQPQIGRRIVIPRIEIPFPTVEVNLTSVRVTPRVRVIRTGRGPI